MRKIAAFAFLLLFLPVWVAAQIPPVGSLAVGTTAITNGTNGLCLYQNGAKLGEQACGIAGSDIWANRPTPTAGTLYYATDVGAQGCLMRANGTRFKTIGSCLVAAVDTPVTGIANSETIECQASFPAALFATGDRIGLRLTGTKSGTTDTFALRMRMGTAGTTADTALYNQTWLVAANKTGSGITDFKITDATHVLQMNINSLGGVNLWYPVAVATTFGSSVAISNVSNPLFFSVSILSSSTNDTVGIQDCQIYLISTPN